MIYIKNIRKKILTVILWVMACFHIYPLILVLLSAVKSKQELAENPVGFPIWITLENFFQSFKTMNYLQSVMNTIIIAVFSVSILIILTSMASYAIARRSNRFYNGIYLFFLAGLIVPFQMVMIPLYKLMLNLQFINTYHGMIFLYLAMLAPFSIFILSGFVKSVPRELEEASLIDGCGTYQTFFYIVFPLLKPAVTTVAVLNIFNVWNDFMMPLLFMQKRARMTLTVQLSSFQGRYMNDWNLIFAGVCMIVLPMLIIYLIAQKNIIEGITAGAVKG